MEKQVYSLDERLLAALLFCYSMFWDFIPNVTSACTDNDYDCPLCFVDFIRHPKGFRRKETLYFSLVK